MKHGGEYYIYILANKKNGVLYVGVTNDLVRRIYEHRNKSIAGFTKQYNIDQLVYYEKYSDIRDAIHREKILKRWKRRWKTTLIEQNNPEWKDLYSELNPI